VTKQSAGESASEKLRGKNGVYKRGGIWVAVVEQPKNAKTGARRRRWSTGFATRKEAEAERDRMRSEIRNGVDVIPKKITVAGYLSRWLAHITPRVAPRTAQSYRGVVEGRLIPTFGATELSRLTALQISEAVAVWASGPRNDGRKGKLSPRSVQIALVVLRMALSQAVKWNVIVRNVAEQVDAPRLERAEQAFVSADDLDRLFVEAEKSDMLPAVAISIGLGLRRAELLGLQWGDIDFERRTVSITRTLQRVDGKLTTKSPKTKLSRRTLVAPAFVLDALRSHRSAQAAQRLALGLGRGGTDAWIFASAAGGPLDMDAFAKRFRRLAERAGLPHVHLHSLRHGYAVLGLQAGIDLKTISSNLGHSSIRLTADTYSHVVSSVGEDAADRIDAIIRGRKRSAT
jgi:integrase